MPMNRRETSKGERMKQFWQVTAVGAVAGGLLAIPAGAAAAPVLSAPLAPCYTQIPPKGVPSIPVSISGGGAGDGFVLEFSDPKGGLGSLNSLGGTFDANGDASLTVTDTYGPTETIDPNPGQLVDVSVNETMPDGSQPDTPLGTTLFTNQALSLGFSYSSNDKPHPISVSGTQFANQSLYAFVVHRSKVVARVSLGKGNVCGYATRKYSLISKHTPAGKYILYVNAGTKLNKTAALSQAYTVERF
jgi:hypothetical protein